MFFVYTKTLHSLLFELSNQAFSSGQTDQTHPPALILAWLHIILESGEAQRSFSVMCNQDR